MPDPFLEVKREVEANLHKAADLARQPQNDSFVTEQLKSITNSIEEDLTDLDETIRIAESNPMRFNLSPMEISGRKEFILKTKRTLAELRGRGDQAARNALFATKSQAKQPQQNPFESSNARFLENEQHQQQLLMKSQDRQLDGVLSTVVNLKEVAHVMGQELNDQTRLLDEMEVQVDTTQGKLQHGMKKMNEFIKANSSSKQQLTIICLIVALVILLIMVFTM